MYFTNICWHEFAKEKPEKEGRYLVCGNDKSNFGIRIINYSHCLHIYSRPFEEVANGLHFIEIVEEYGDYAGDRIIDSEIGLWAKLDSMEEELKSYIFKEERNK